MGKNSDSHIPSRDNGSALTAASKGSRRRVAAWLDIRNVGWDMAAGLLQRVTGSPGGDKIDSRITGSVRELVSGKSRSVRDEFEALAQAVMRTGSYQAKDDAVRAMRAVIDALGDHVPPNVLLKLSEHLPRAEAARLRRAANLQRHSKKKPDLKQPVSLAGGSKSG